MPGGKSDFLENEWLDHVLGAAMWTIGTVFVALYNTMPNDAGGGATEIAAGGYARVSVTNNLTNWPAAVAGAKSNGAAITFPQATADWNTIGGVAILNTSSGGNMLFIGPVVPVRVVANGDTPSFAVNDLDVTED